MDLEAPKLPNGLQKWGKSLSVGFFHDDIGNIFVLVTETMTITLESFLNFGYIGKKLSYAGCINTRQATFEVEYLVFLTSSLLTFCFFGLADFCKKKIRIKKITMTVANKGHKLRQPAVVVIFVVLADVVIAVVIVVVVLAADVVFAVIAAAAVIKIRVFCHL